MLRKKLKGIIIAALLGVTVGIASFCFMQSQVHVPEYHSIPIEQQEIVDYTDTILSELTAINKQEIYQCYLKNTCTIHQGYNNNFFRCDKDISVYANGIYKIDLSNIQKNLVISGNKVIVTASIETDVIVQENKFQFADKKGWLTFYDVQVTPEDMASIVAEAAAQMQSKMLSDEYMPQVIEKANRVITDRLQSINPNFEVSIYWR